MTAETLKTPASWDKGSLLMKAQKYAEEMSQYEANDWQFGLWASFALELLARSALSNVSPTLLADSGNWRNTLHSLGHQPTANKFLPKSVAISEVLTRLGEIYPDFNTELSKFCIGHTGMRNAELHSGDLPYDELKHSSWLPSYYRACAVLLKTMDLTLSDHFGGDVAEVADKLMAAALDNAAKEVNGKIKSHYAVWEGKSKDEKELLVKQALVWATKQAGHRADCPACSSAGVLHGEPIAPPTKKLDDDVIIEKQQYLPSKFECIACQLKISGLSYLNQAGLGDIYIRTEEYDAVEYYAPEVDWSQYEPDNNEPY
jgi:hypothetical protein